MYAIIKIGSDFPKSKSPFSLAKSCLNSDFDKILAKTFLYFFFCNMKKKNCGNFEIIFCKEIQKKNLKKLTLFFKS